MSASAVLKQVMADIDTLPTRLEIDDIQPGDVAVSNRGLECSYATLTCVIHAASLIVVT